MLLSVITAFFVLVSNSSNLRVIRQEESNEKAIYDLSPPPTFKRIVIDSNFSSGYQIKSADLNGNGKPDLIAVSTSLTEIVWYENPSWEKHTLYRGTQANIDLAPHDIDGDRDMDLAIASMFSLGNSISGGYVHWLENIDQGKSWKLHFIDSLPTSHRLRWADLDGDGKEELVNLPIIGQGAHAPDYDAPVQFCYYKIPVSPIKDPWPKLIIDSSLHMAHGMQLVQWPESTKWSILTASFEGVNLFTSNIRGEKLTWKKTHLGEGQLGIRPKIGSSEIGLGKLGPKDSPFLATIEPWHGDKIVVYRPGLDQKLWQRQIIDRTFHDGHALLCADLNQDGNDEIVAGHRGKDYNLYIYQYSVRDQQWRRSVLDPGGMSAAGLCLVDFNADGFPDIAACGSATNNIVLYVNNQ